MHANKHHIFNSLLCLQDEQNYTKLWWSGNEAGINEQKIYDLNLSIIRTVSVKK